MSELLKILWNLFTSLLRAGWNIITAEAFPELIAGCLFLIAIAALFGAINKYK